MTQCIETPVATGELIDKITILEIKVARFTDLAKRANAQAELSLLVRRRAAALPPDAALDVLAARLLEVNQRIWDLEDTVRDHERRRLFDAGFIDAARRIYRTNDERAALKREINLASGSTLIEEKPYSAY